MTAPVLYLEVPVAHEWASVEALRQLVRDRLVVAYGDAARAKLHAMVAAELLENAVKYGRWTDGPPGGLATLRVVCDARTVTVTVTNPVDPDQPGVQRLLAILHGLGEVPAADAYQARLSALAQDPTAGGAGLGLARVAHEAGCSLSAGLTAEGILRVVGVMTR